ncbi:hypothetical protein A2892_02440 [Candidatus Woesebacteria bacterium RIFCSPLOWO2_01_FULL_39_10b]|uniref:Transglutaminase-like domain-containing protein n=2 Tax=Candidatus Woeseibacteriota TaxID=1752722 RepID=A0A1F8B625_9BACT|nr:MAG: hypothetical protein A2892_02440 [Candidatus Woesebacteria bacterium RIFCSPLOWO2_01_FULL_39_10b]
MRKKILVILFFFFNFFIKVDSLYAKEFTTSANLEYKVDELGIVNVTNTISIKNNKSEKFAGSFILNLKNVDPQDIQAFEKAIKIPIRVNKENDTFQLILDFPEKVVGKDNLRTFVLTYQEKNLVSRIGEIWEISIPKILDNTFDNYNLTLSIPNFFGELAYISPEQTETKLIGGRRLYIFKGEEVRKLGVNVIFGSFQTYDFRLTYHLKNTSEVNSLKDITIPPDTPSQKVYLDKISPPPIDLKVDTDGNWLAFFSLKPKEVLDIEASGSIQIFSKPVNYFATSPANLVSNSKPTKFWQADDPEIIKLAQELESPKDIYDFVVNYLSYNYDKVKPNEEAGRLGAREALFNPSFSTCREFTDLFIAISRAKGIPAREINGYADSDNPKIQPLSLVSDILHSWVEYWNDQKKTWIPIDPTWEATSGINYFDKFDLKHLAFVIHGEDDTLPYPAGSYKIESELEKDVHVTPSLDTVKNVESLEINHKESTLFLKNRIDFEIKNSGSTAFYNLNADIIMDGKNIRNEFIKVFPPYAKYHISLEVTNGILASKAPFNIIIRVGKEESDIFINKGKIIVKQLLFLSCLLVIVIVIFFFRPIRKRLVFVNNYLVLNVRKFGKIKFRKNKS